MRDKSSGRAVRRTGAGRRAVAAAAAGLFMASCTVPPEGRDTGNAEPVSELTLISGGPIYTGNDDMPMAAGVVFDADGQITQVLDEAALLDGNALHDVITRIDLGGAALYPGFVDAHAHLRGIGERELTLDLSGAVSLADMVTQVEAEQVGTAPGDIIFGRGWIETDWPEGRMPMAADLDTVAPENLVLLVRADGHALVANTAALEAAGITDETLDPDGGAIERDASGAATGMLIDNAMGPVLGLVDRADEAAVIEALAVGAQVYAERGWTGVHNMSVSAMDVRAIERLDLENRMPLRVYNAVDEDAFSVAASRAHETDTVTNRAVKLYMDGALGSRGALLSAPYEDRPDTTGLQLLAPDALATLFDRADAAGVQLAIHAIGDLANTRVIEAAEVADLSTARHRIEHTQILRPQDIARLAPAGLIASMQPSHAIGDLKFAPDRLGMDRLRGAYAWQSLIDAGAIVAAGSDAPVEVGSPLIEFYAATVREALDGTTGPGWHPEEAVDRTTALKMLTAWPAYAAFQEDQLGTISVGKRADFTGFDRDLMTVDASEILDAVAVLTIVEGEVVYSALGD